MRQGLLFVLVFSAACGPSIRTGEGDASGPTSASGAGGAGGFGGGDAGGFGGSGVVVVPCTPPGSPAAGPLCGPPDTPCKILVSESLPVPDAFRNDAPGLALNEVCAPEILLASAEGKYDGFYAVKNLMGEWSVTPTPFAFASGGLVRSPGGLPLALANDGAFGASLFGFFGGGWEHISDVPAQATHYERSFSQAPNGDLFVGIATDTSELLLGKYDGAWSMTNLGQTASPVPVAVSPEGSPHVFHWEAPGAAWIFRWTPVPEAQETVFSLGSNSLSVDEQRAALVVTAADGKNPMGKPHGLVVRGGPGGASELVYATREGASAWSLVHVETAPTGEGLQPLGGVTDELGDVRLFYARTQYGSPNAGQVVVVWPKEDGTVGKANVMDGLNTTGASFERDGAGRIHVALYSIVSGSSFDVRYVILGT